MKSALVILMAVCLGMTGCTTSRIYSPGDGQMVAAGGILVAHCGVKLDNCGD